MVRKRLDLYYVVVRDYGWSGLSSDVSFVIDDVQALRKSHHVIVDDAAIFMVYDFFADKRFCMVNILGCKHVVLREQLVGWVL